MFDRSVRAVIDPALEKIGQLLAGYGVSANTVTWTGFAFGFIAALLIATHNFGWGLMILLVSRLCDGLDGSVARATSGSTDMGGFLDIVLDFAFYGAIPFAFIVADPQSNALAGGLLLLVFYINGASFLTYAMMVEKRGSKITDRGKKSFLYTAGLAEGTETIGVFILFCLFPDWFSIAAYAFSAVVAVTTISRFAMAYKAFR